MSSFIKPNRAEISRAFPVLGFTIRTGASPSWFEIALATNPALFEQSNLAHRTPDTFFCTRADGLLPADASDVVYLLPQQILERFVGQHELYYAMAVHAKPDGSAPLLVRMPAGAPPVRLSESLAASGRRVRAGVASRITTPDPRSLTWAGDDIAAPAVPATAPAVVAPPVAAPVAEPAPVLVGAGVGHANGNGSPAPPAPATAQSYQYSDGFSDDFWSAVDTAGGQPASALASDAAVEDDPSLYGIDGPIADGAPTAAAQWLSSAALAAGTDYPHASRFVASPHFNSRPNGRTINRIVIHITDGNRSIEGPIATFQSTAKVSAHYIVGQDGEVVQMVHDRDIAWHAKRANGDSIGIEHVASAGTLVPRFLPTEDEYRASARLVRWLCQQYSLPIDRDHIVGHAEADPSTSHTGCPRAAWDWDAYMALVTNPATDQVPTATAQSGRIFYDVPLIPQPDKMSCWAASMAMVLSFRRRQSVTPELVARESGNELRVTPTHSRMADARDHFGFRVISLPSNMSLSIPPAQWEQWLRDYGPLLVEVVGDPSHEIVVQGMEGDGTPDGTTVYIANPWDERVEFDRNDRVDFKPPNPGQAEVVSFSELDRRFGLMARPDRGEWRVMHLPPQSQAQGFAASSAVSLSTDISYDVPLIPQPDKLSCWAASMAMLISAKQQQSVSPEQICQDVGRSLRTSYSWDQLTAVRDHFRFEHLTLPADQSLAAFPVSTWEGWLRDYGPLWITITGAPSHAVVVSGIRGDGTEQNTTVTVLNPWDESVTFDPNDPIDFQPPNAGRKYTQTYADFCSDFGNFSAGGQIQGEWRVLYLPGSAHAQAQGAGTTASPLAATPIDPAAVEQMRQTLVANAGAARANRQDCITIMNSALRSLLGARTPALGDRVDRTMQALVNAGLASPGEVFEFLDAAGRRTLGALEPDRLERSIEGWISSQAGTVAECAWYVFGLSILDGYHSVLLAFQFDGPGEPTNRLYWCDQVGSGWDDVTGTFDAQLTDRTKGWWSGQPDPRRKPRTRATIWPITG